MGLKQVGILAAAAAVAFAPAAGCRSDSKPVASDEQQIRDLIDKQEAAFADFDFDRMAELTCAQYREEVRAQEDSLIPPISEFGTAAELAGKSAELASRLKQQFPTASEPTINRLADALASYDEPAYREAFRDLLSETVKLRVDKVENVVVTGDTATADITSTTTTGDAPPETETKSNDFAKEDGEWKDCELSSSS